MSTSLLRLLPLVLLLLLAAAARAADKPNIVLVMADDQGWGDMGYNGHPILKTPHFDAMAKEAIRFDRFYAAAPVCTPTRGSVMTGRHPNRFGCFSWGHTLRPQEVTIAEALRTAGYRTGHFGKWHLGSVRMGSPVNPGASGFDEWVSAPNFYDNDPIMSHNGVAKPVEGESSMVAVDAALDFIRRHKDGEEPFLAVVWFGSPHVPHQAVAQDREPYAGEPQRFQHFYGEITGMDRAFGKLRSQLREMGIHDNTILWYTSDNGGLPRFGATGGRGNKGHIYEGGLRVPAMLEWPAKYAGQRVTDVPATTSDIYPTLLEIVGVRIERQPRLDGVSLVPLLEGQTEERGEGIGFWDHPTRGIRTPSKEWMAQLYGAQRNGDTTGNPERLRLDAGRIDEQHPTDVFPGHSAWLAWPWKLHRVERGDQPVRYELYNLAKDPMEATDVIDSEAERAGELRSDLLAWLSSVARSLNGGDY